MLKNKNTRMLKNRNNVTLKVEDSKQSTHIKMTKYDCTSQLSNA